MLSEECWAITGCDHRKGRGVPMREKSFLQARNARFVTPSSIQHLPVPSCAWQSAFCRHSIHCCASNNLVKAIYASSKKLGETRWSGTGCGELGRTCMPVLAYASKLEETNCLVVRAAAGNSCSRDQDQGAVTGLRFQGFVQGQQFCSASTGLHTLCSFVL